MLRSRRVALRRAVFCVSAAVVIGLRPAPLPARITLPVHPEIWITHAEIAALPMSGPAWENLLHDARQPVPPPDLSNQNDRTNVIVLAKALAFARNGDESYRGEVLRAIDAAMGTERGGRTLSVARQLGSYVIAADLVGLPPEQDEIFCDWLRSTLDLNLEGRTLRTTHEQRPNNWGTHAGASRLAAALYLGSKDEVARCAQVFHGWLGDRASYAGFEFGDLAWQSDPARPVGINPPGATHDGYSIDGVLPDDQRRSGPFAWPPPHENYVYEALQGAVAQAVMLQRAGYPVWDWEDRALLRAFIWLQSVANYPAIGDDTWMQPILDRAYGTRLWDGSPTHPGKSIGWTDWTHARP